MIEQPLTQAREWFPKVAEGIPCTVLGSGQSKHAHLFITADLEKCLIAGPNKDIVVPVDCMRYVWDWKEAFSNPSVLEQLRMLGLQDYPDEEKRRIFVLHVSSSPISDSVRGPQRLPEGPLVQGTFSRRHRSPRDLHQCARILCEEHAEQSPLTVSWHVLFVVH